MIKLAVGVFGFIIGTTLPRFAGLSFPNDALICGLAGAWVAYMFVSNGEYLKGRVLPTEVKIARPETAFAMAASDLTASPQPANGKETSFRTSYVPHVIMATFLGSLVLGQGMRDFSPDKSILWINGIVVMVVLYLIFGAGKAAAELFEHGWKVAWISGGALFTFCLMGKLGVSLGTGDLEMDMGYGYEEEDFMIRQEGRYYGRYMFQFIEYQILSAVGMHFGCLRRARK